jgi:hypothetical protein
LRREGYKNKKSRPFIRVGMFGRARLRYMPVAQNKTGPKKKGLSSKRNKGRDINGWREVPPA